MRRHVSDGRLLTAPGSVAGKRLVDVDRQQGTLSPYFACTRPPSLLLWRDVRGIMTKIEGGI